MYMIKIFYVNYLVHFYVHLLFTATTLSLHSINDSNCYKGKIMYGKAEKWNARLGQLNGKCSDFQRRKFFPWSVVSVDTVVLWKWMEIRWCLQTHLGFQRALSCQSLQNTLRNPKYTSWFLSEKIYMGVSSGPIWDLQLRFHPIFPWILFVFIHVI